jgi:hypothetical protein
MTTFSTRQSLLKQIASIQHMERGKLCVIRPGPNGPYYNLQNWENGRNVTRYVPPDQVSALQADLAAYAQFQSLVEQYAQEVIQQTRAERAGGVKKKRPGPGLAPGPGPGNPTGDGPL